MNEAEKEQYRRYVEGWQHAGPELERIRREELRAMDDRMDLDGMDALADIGVRYGTPRTTSGLVEMQKWFMELARQQGLLSPTVGNPPGEYQAGTGKSGGPTSASAGIGRDRAHSSRNRGFIKPDREP
ncbi:MAG: hypothetical protein RBT03_05940 [Kiritimatiellia bacterium]|jgi:hypothetical protein|nr:hypothetical protein [Kiritimatiellia bacterium]